MENLETQSHPPIQWIKPDIVTESGEFQRVAAHFLPDTEPAEFYTKCKTAFEQAEPQELAEDIWSILENTDSWESVMPDDMNAAVQLAENYGKDMERIKQNINAGNAIETPIIINYQGTHHLVSGNTRLMISRALRETPKVIIIKVD